MIPIRDTANGATFSIRVQPGAKKTAITGIYGEGADAAVKLSLTAPPIDGRANDAVIEFLADLLGLAKSHVSILFGVASRSKVVQVAGVSSLQIAAILIRHLPSA